MPFLEQVVCDIWSVCRVETDWRAVMPGVKLISYSLSPFYSSTEVQSVFWLTSCHHVLCGKKDGRHQREPLNHPKRHGSHANRQTGYMLVLRPTRHLRDAHRSECQLPESCCDPKLIAQLRPDQRSWFTAPDITISQLFKAADRTEVCS